MEGNRQRGHSHSFNKSRTRLGSFVAYIYGKRTPSGHRKGNELTLSVILGRMPLLRCFGSVWSGGLEVSKQTACVEVYIYRYTTNFEKKKKVKSRLTHDPEIIYSEQGGSNKRVLPSFSGTSRSITRKFTGVTHHVACLPGRRREDGLRPPPPAQGRRRVDGGSGSSAATYTWPSSRLPRTPRGTHTGRKAALIAPPQQQAPSTRQREKRRGERKEMGNRLSQQKFMHRSCARRSLQAAQFLQ